VVYHDVGGADRRPDRRRDHCGTDDEPREHAQVIEWISADQEHVSPCAFLEHAKPGRRGLDTSWINMMATGGLLLVLAWLAVEDFVDQRNGAAWAREWEKVEPRWSGRRSTD